MTKKVFTAIGLMTGTSLDGVDLSLVKTDGYNEFTSILDNYYKFDDKLQKTIVDLRDRISNNKDLIDNSNELDDLERKITLFHSKVVNEVLSNFKGNVDLIGFHGQTIYHNPDLKISKQLGDGKLLSQLTKKIVVNNFRQKDLENNGQGAPLTPIFHKTISKIISQKHKINLPINIINIGGISNATIVFNYKNEINIKARDIGPGNCLIDEWVRINSKFSFDKNGNIARSGKINELIANQAKENFAINSYEKSFDIKDFDLSFARGLSLEDGCATITDFTAYLISEGLRYINSLKKGEHIYLLLSGGGRKNIYLIELIKKYLSDINIKLKNIDDFGFDGDFIESKAFAYLAIRSYLGLPISFPETTRCKDPTVGGDINKNF
jgi:anhydro-N-acetylmuramic acid kinase